MDQRAVRDELRDDPSSLGGVRGPENGDPVRLERGGCPSDALIVGQSPESRAGGLDRLRLDCGCQLLASFVAASLV
jgi:hypothetical protein